MPASSLGAPSTDGTWLADPPLDAAAGLITSNRQTLDHAAQDVAGRPLASLRAEARGQMHEHGTAWLEQLGIEPGLKPVDGVVMTGHQPELFHPGVWFKNFVTGALARFVGGTGWNLVVDNDVPKTFGVRVPTGTRDEPRAEFESLDTVPGGIPYEELTVVDEERCRSFPQRVASRMREWNIRSLVERLWELLPPQAGKSPKWVDRLTAARARLEREMGCANGEITVSAVSRLPAFAHFVADVVCRIDEFVTAHNEALAAYRLQHKIRSAHNPMPDLATDGDRLETPFWVWSEGQGRGRLFVRHRRDKLVLQHGTEDILELDPSGAVEAIEAIEASGWKVRPRALTNTMFCRLFLCDLFVHGIGGALYDTVGDAIIRRFFDVEPPAFLTATATLRLPIDPHPVGPGDLATAKHRLRDLVHNPDRHLDGLTREDPKVAALVTEKQRLLAEVASGVRPRSELFLPVRQLNWQLRDAVRPLRHAARDSLAEIESRLSANTLLTSREYAFCLFPLDTLTAFFSRVTLAI